MMSGLVAQQHAKGADPRLARWQNRLNPIWHAVACSGNCNRNTDDAIRAAGFTITDIEHGEVQEEKALVRPTIWGRAV